MDSVKLSERNWDMVNAECYVCGTKKRLLEERNEKKVVIA